MQRTRANASGSYATIALQRLLPSLVLFLGNVAAVIADTITLLGATYQRFVRARSRPRPAHQVKPHPSAVYKG